MKQAIAYVIGLAIMFVLGGFFAGRLYGAARRLLRKVIGRPVGTGKK